MVKIRASVRQDRMERVCYEIAQVNGLTEREIADRLQLERRTINNYLMELENQGLIYKEGIYWYIDEWTQAKSQSLPLNPESSVYLYLAARLLVKSTDRRSEAAETLLYRLVETLPDVVGQDLRDAVFELSNREIDESYNDVFLAVLRGYVYRRQVTIDYEPYNGNPFRTTISPYLLEPSAIGYAVYVIGHSSTPNALRTYKIGRITRATLTRESFEVPADFPGLELLKNAWSIYYGEATQTIALHFSPAVTRRILETQWHPSQRLFPQNDSSLIMELDVADTTDLIPWIRGWGAACEVLAPDDLRDQFVGETRAAAMLYGWNIHKSFHASEDDPLNLDQTLTDFFD